MPLFQRRTQDASLLPGDIVRRMEYYGRFEFSPQESESDAPQRINELIYQALYPVASADPDRFIAEPADAVGSRWRLGRLRGERCVRDLINAQTRHPGYVAMVDAAIKFLFSQGYGMIHVAPYERDIWDELHPDGRW